MSSRLDFFIVYGNGIDHIHDIINIIRDDDNFEILYIKKINAVETVRLKYEQFQLLENNDSLKSLLYDKFISDLYSCDTVPYEHLKGKTRYLLNHTSDLFFILVDNKVPDEQFYGDGDFRHIQCAKVKNIKEIVRNKFNRRTASGERIEEHVIHGSDYESQTEFVLNYLDLPNKEYFRGIPNADFDLKCHISKFYKYEIVDIDIDSIYCKTFYETTLVSDSIFYKYLLNDKVPYNNYIDNIIGVHDFDDHYSENFDKLIENFNYTKRNYILVNKRDDGMYDVVDGNHRIAKLKIDGAKIIKAVVAVPLSNKLNLKWLFEYAPINYAVLRNKEWFPHYHAGEDIDILTDDVDKLTTHVMHLTNAENIEVKIHWTNNHRHVDIYIDGTFDVRFDLTTTLENDKFSVSKDYTRILLDRAEKITKNGITFLVPNMVDELITRYFEYTLNPHKTQHLNFVNDNMCDTFSEELIKNSSLIK